MENGGGGGHGFLPFGPGQRAPSLSSPSPTRFRQAKKNKMFEKKKESEIADLRMQLDTIPELEESRDQVLGDINAQRETAAQPGAR